MLRSDRVRDASAGDSIASPALGGLTLGLLLGLASLGHPPASSAEGLPVEYIQGFLDEVRLLGPLGPALFIGSVITAELIPLFPTQPLALTAGLLFGPVEGAAFMLAGTLVAALVAFTIARKSGSGQNFLASEGSDNDARWRQALSGVQSAIEDGDLWQQLVAMTFLRLTPVAPFSASNYLLGLTPIALPAFAGGTVIGMGVWSLVYASIGGAGRSLLQNGVGLDVLLTDMYDKATLYSEEAGAAAAVLALALGGWYLLTRDQGEQA